MQNSLVLNIFTNKEFTSNAFLGQFSDSKNAFLVDIGEYLELKKYIDENGIHIRQLFLTHGHYDHIYYINSLLNDFPDCKVFASEFTLESLFNPKLNLSFYHLDPIIYKGKNIEVLKDGVMIEIGQNRVIKCLHTPGHNTGSVVYVLDNYLFTGDSLIPGIPVVTKLPFGDKLQNKLSLMKISSLIEGQTIICPGHGNVMNGFDFINNYSIN